MINGGYCGKLIEVNLSTGKIDIKPLPSEEILKNWIGCAGLGLYLLSQEVTPEMKSTDPEAPVFVMTGPLTGTKSPSASNWTIITLHDGVHFAPCISHGHGHFGARLKHAGFDGIIIRGQSTEPVYLWIDDQTVELRKADKYWGMDTMETVRKIQLDHKDLERVSVACIGPAGEEVMPGASVRSDMAYGCSRGGSGVAWGAKKLKAIAVRGTNNVPIYNYEKFIENSEEWREKVKNNIGYLPWLDEAGYVLFLKNAGGPAGAIQAMNYEDKNFGVEWAKRFEEDVKQWKVEPEGSWECDIKCHHNTLVTTGPHAGTRCIGYGAECLQDAGTLLGIEDPGTCLMMSMFYDSMGSDPAVPGRKIAMAFEMYNKGLLTEEDTGGLKLEWGNDEAARELFMQIMYRQEPLGRILAKPYKEAIAELGGSEDMFIHVKGVGQNSHDNLAFGYGYMFSLLVSGNGPNWSGNGAFSGPDPDLGYMDFPNGDDLEGIPKGVYESAIKKGFDDCTGVCYFMSLGCKGVTKYQPNAVSLATGLEINWEQAWLVGERLMNLQRLYALKRGFTRADDLDVSDRILIMHDGPAKGRNLKVHLNELLDKYYTQCGWDLDGVPKPETLKRLGLENFQIGPSK